MTELDLAAIVQALYGPLVLYARQLCDCPDDVVQDAFLEFHRQTLTPSGAGLPRDLGHVRAWLFRAVRHRALNDQRRQRRQMHFEAAYGQQRSWFTATSDSSVDIDEAVDALQSLAEDLRETIVARIWGQMTLAQIAELTEVSLATAQRRYLRGLQQLRQQLDGQTRANPLQGHKHE